MFPSLGLLSKIDFNRGTLCLYRHRPSCTSGPPNMETSKFTMDDDHAMDISEEIRLEDELFTPSPPPPPQQKEQHQQSKNSVQATPIIPEIAKPKPGPEPKPKPNPEPKPEPAKQATAEPSRPTIKPTALKPAPFWRELTLNHDPNSPAFDKNTELQPTVPSLKAIVGDRVGYMKRQKTLEKLHVLFAKLTDVEEIKEKPWVPAMLAVENELQIYNTSVAGTYHSKLLLLLRELKSQMP
ncbi:hypothetical protein BX661DRAFT_182421 [Kickxella alabastrina]|uniref:uncharacterized protein n=1 Tax=Kickxella alabastrina TaxID=61397 RepID=UPI00221FA628|nr:uncharacterized protein BX661DRAFT_182421 [Kickxella alabastrina]KAI7827776.1 hypothetical protein BX661DRAFT_182421 [Kickxella alabastrina]